MSDYNKAREDISKACSLFVSALDPRDFGEDYANLIKRGSTRIEAQFKTPLTELLNMSVIDIFPSLLQIYQSGTVKCIQPGKINS